MKKIYLLLLLASSIVLTTCKKEEPETERTPKLAENVKVFSTDLNASLIEPRRNSLKFADANPFFSTIEAGDILVYEGDSDTGAGAFLRQVTAIEYEKDGAFIYYTKPASVIDLFDDISIEYSTALLSEEFPIDVILYDKDEDEETMGDQVHVTGNFELDVALDQFVLDIHDGDISSILKTKVEATQELDCSIGLLNGNLDFEPVEWEPVDFPTIFIPTGLFVLPRIPLTPSVVFSFGADGSVQASVSFGTTATGIHETTVSYQSDDGWSFGTEESLNFDNRSSYEANGFFEVFAQAGVGVDIFKENFFSDDPLLEGQFFAKAYLRAEADITESPPCKILAGVRLGVEVDALFVDEPYENDMLADFSKIIFECEEEEPEDGIFTIFPFQLEAVGLLSDLAVSPDGTVVWATDGFNLYRYNDAIEDFDKIPFIGTVHVPLLGGVETVFSIDIHPTTQELFVYVNAPSVTSAIPIIYKQSGNSFEPFYEFANSKQFSISIDFDPFGDLWFWIYEEGIDDSLEGLYRLDNMGSVTLFNNFSISVSPGIGSSPFDVFKTTFSSNGRPILYSLGNEDQIYELNPSNNSLSLLTDNDAFSLISLRQGIQLRNGTMITSGYSKDSFEPVLGHYISSSDTTFYFLTFGTTIPSFEQLPVTFHESPNGGVWFSLSNVRDRLYYYSDGIIQEFLSTNSNLPDNFAEGPIGDIEGGITGSTWITYGANYILRVGG